MKETTIENVKVHDLPVEWARCIDASPDERVDVTIRRATPNSPHRNIDRTAVQELLRSVSALPVLNENTPDEIIGYDENGLPA